MRSLVDSLGHRLEAGDGERGEEIPNSPWPPTEAANQWSTKG